MSCYAFGGARRGEVTTIATAMVTVKGGFATSSAQQHPVPTANGGESVARPLLVSEWQSEWESEWKLEWGTVSKAEEAQR